MIDDTIPNIPGAEAVVLWFGRWPSFHDAEIIELHLERQGPSRLRVHAWNMTDRTHEKEHKQYFISEKHAIVTFELENVVDLILEEFNHQNVLSGLALTFKDDAYHLDLGNCYGMHGQITASRVRVSLEPGEPEGE